MSINVKPVIKESTIFMEGRSCRGIVYDRNGKRHEDWNDAGTYLILGPCVECGRTAIKATCLENSQSWYFEPTAIGWEDSRD